MNKYLLQYQGRFALKNGREILIRPILETDAVLIVDLFQKLSEHSRYRRFLRRLDVLPEKMVYQFTHMDYNRECALAGISEEDGKEAIIAVARYAYPLEESLPELAIVVRDDWQHLGLGKTLLKEVVEIGKSQGICRFGGMIDSQNRIIRLLLEELGFKVNYTLKSGVFQVEILV